jgi:hypothetical protein
MKFWSRTAAAALLVCLSLASTATGQKRVPDRNMFAIGLFGGLSIPSEDVLTSGGFIGVNGEGYLTPRISVKGQFGGTFYDVEGNGLDGKVRPWHLTGSLAYNWEGGKIHPYVSGGIGIYKYRFGEGDNRPSDTKVGVNLGGGIEYFFTRTDTLVGDLTLHLVPGTADSNIFGYHARFTTIAAGYKKYF